MWLEKSISQEHDPLGLKSTWFENCISQEQDPLASARQAVVLLSINKSNNRIITSCHFTDQINSTNQ